MKYTPKILKAAWKIRNKAAKKFKCNILSISWRGCLKAAMMKCKKTIDKWIKIHSSFDSLKDLTNNTIKYGYKPSLNTTKSFQLELLADAYDSRCKKLGIKSKAFRY